MANDRNRTAHQKALIKERKKQNVIHCGSSSMAITQLILLKGWILQEHQSLFRVFPVWKNPRDIIAGLLISDVISTGNPYQLMRRNSCHFPKWVCVNIGIWTLTCSCSFSLETKLSSRTKPTSKLFRFQESWRFYCTRCFG